MGAVMLRVEVWVQRQMDNSHEVGNICKQAVREPAAIEPLDKEYDNDNEFIDRDILIDGWK